jgi:hypothetical protein
MLQADCDRLKAAEQRDRADRDAVKARDRSLLDRRRAIPARYAGACGGCGEHFPVGTPISSRGGGEFRASCCLDEQGAPTR